MYLMKLSRKNCILLLLSIVKLEKFDSKFTYCQKITGKLAKVARLTLALPRYFLDGGLPTGFQI